MIFFINPDKITKPLILIFHCFGLWRPRAVTGLVYQIYGILYLTFSCTLTTLMILHLTLLEDRSELSSALWAMLTAICITIKSIYIYAHNYELQQMVGRIRKFRLKNEKEHILVEKHLTLIYRVGTFLACSMFGAGYLKMITAPMFEKPTLPFEAWYPFLDWENSRRDYWLAVLLQFVGFNTVVIFVPVTDTLFSFMIFIVSIEFQIVGMRLEEIGGPSAMPRYNDEAKAIRELVECIKLHIRTLKFKESIQKFMNFPYSCYIAASGISISAIIAELVAGNGDRFSNATGAMGLITQIFIICFFADKTIEKSTELPTQLYKSNWIELVARRKNGKKFKKILLNFMTCTQRETSFFVGDIFPLNLRTFAAILNFAYRLFALIYNKQ